MEGVSPDNVELKLDYHSKLNPDLWTGNKLRVKVRKALLNIAKEFKEYLEMPEIQIVDVIITGSMANYNWTVHSDIDLHIIVSVKKEDATDCQAIDIKDVFDTKQALWKERHDIKIYNHPVEIYVQFADEDVIAAGIYSLTLDTWIEKPKHDKSGESFNRYAVKVKAAQVMTVIDKAIEQNATTETIQKIKDKIRAMRKSGLDQGGEFSVENLAFKTLRNEGYLKKLYDYMTLKKDKQLSLK